MKKIAVILSGCGYLDGAEITESVSLLINLSQLNVEYEVYAPHKTLSTTAHLNSEFVESEKRHIIEEAARITRGRIKPLDELNPQKFDGLALPGGYGVAKNFCTWAHDGADCSVDPKVKEIVSAFHDQSKPILALCIAPALIAKVLGKHTPDLHLTIGNDGPTIEQIEKTGATHVECNVDDFVTDRENKVISSPAYMYDAQPHEVFMGITKASKEFIEMC